MKYSTVINALQDLIKSKPSQQAIAKLLGVGQTAISGRANRDSEFSQDELLKLEIGFGLPIGVLSESNKSDCLELDYYPNIYASCGSGSTIFDESSEKISVGHALIADYSSNKKYSVIVARGSSMEPTLLDEDKLIVEHWNGGQIIDNHVYLFRYDNELFVKRLIKNVDEIICVSDNAEYSKRTLQPTKVDFAIIGKVVGLFRGRV